jgi:ABC-type polysaccharide/polyol phosphate transport system, ATPase component
MNENVISVKNVTKTYRLYNTHADRVKEAFHPLRKKYHRPFNALEDVSFDIKRGEPIGIIGRNGSGKSTLLQIICGILQPTSGNVEVDGRVSALLELGAGFNPEFTGRENVYINGAILGLKRGEIDARFDDIARFADIGDFIDQPVKTYSSGMYVRLAFAIAVNVSSNILVVDEALSVGDARFQQKCMAKIREFCRTGTVILVSHDTAAVTELCSRAIWVESGRIRLDGIPKLVVEKYLQFMYEGDAGDKKSAPKDFVDSTGSIDMSEFSAVGGDIRQFGDRRVTIDGVRLISQGSRNGVVYAGQACEIGVALSAHEDIANPIVGFTVKDRLGREILGDNTKLIRKEISSLSSGQRYVITFRIDAWPNIIEGEYAITVAVADGTLNDHIQCHYLHDAVIFKNVPVRVPGGIFSVPDTTVSFFQESGQSA